MQLKTKKQMAARVFGCSPQRVVFDNERLSDIKEAITKTDIKSLIQEGAIIKKPIKGISRARANKRRKQKVKGKRKGQGKRKGTIKTRTKGKQVWINKIRKQREFLKKLKEKNLIGSQTYALLYKKAKGNFFRSKRHIKIYLDEHNLIKK